MCTLIEKLPACETFSSTHTHTHTHARAHKLHSPYTALSGVPGKGTIKLILQGTIYKVLNEGRV